MHFDLMYNQMLKMLDIKIDPQLPQTQDPPLTSGGERGQRGEDCVCASRSRRRTCYPEEVAEAKIAFSPESQCSDKR